MCTTSNQMERLGFRNLSSLDFAARFLPLAASTKFHLGDGSIAFGELINLAKFGNANPDFLKEVYRILDAAKSENVRLRLLGALAFHIHCPKFSTCRRCSGVPSQI